MKLVKLNYINISYRYNILSMKTLNYIGCKKTLYKNIISLCQSKIPDFNKMIFLDLFAGTGIVGFNMQEFCKYVSSNDLEYYSFIVSSALLKCNYSDKLQEIINECNEFNDDIEDEEFEEIPYLVYKNFSPNDECERMFFTNENAIKCDKIRYYLNSLLEGETISKNEFYFLLASLLVSIDKVANTSCVYGAYLKKFKKSALKEMILEPLHTKTDINIEENNVTNEFAEKLMEKDSTVCDVLYMDPPYNQRQYSANYSPLNYIALYDEDIELKGKTGLIKDYEKSDLCSKVKAVDSFKHIIDNAKCKYIILSYNNEGIIPYDLMKKIMMSKGKTTLYKIQYKKFKAQKSVEEKFVYEYLWLCRCGKGGKFSEIETELL